MRTILRNEVMKGNKYQTDDKLSDLTDVFPKIHNDEQLVKHNLNGEERNIVKVIQPKENMDTECNERPLQSTATKALNKKINSAGKHKIRNTSS